jgi:hypothetical protein
MVLTAQVLGEHKSNNKPLPEGPTTGQVLQGCDSSVPLLVVKVSSHGLTNSAPKAKRAS